MNTTKILTEQIRDLTVSSLPTRPTAPTSLGGRGFSPSEMKEAFDRLPLFIAERLNSLIGEIRGEDGTVTDAIPTGLKDGHTLSDLFADVESGELASYLKVLGKSLAVQIGDILERLDKLDGGEK